jgi:hypothetical protein
MSRGGVRIASAYEEAETIRLLAVTKITTWTYHEIVC